MNIVYMGTPDFAVPALKAIAGAGFQVSAVFCQPDRSKGRSKKPVPCPVKEAALALDIPVHQPVRIRAKKWVALLRDLAPDVIVVAAFGQILPQSILDIPTIDCVNLHASILPRWRGASPIHHAISAGDAETGVALMRMTKELDAGPVYDTVTVPIDGDTRREALERTLAIMGAELALKHLPNLSTMEPIPQDESGATYAPIIQKSDGFIDPKALSALEIDRLVRGFENWPGIWCSFRQQPLKLIEVEPMEGLGEPGSLVEITKKRLVLACREGLLLCKTLQPAGKKAMPAAAFINGYKPEVGEVFNPMPKD